MRFPVDRYYEEWNNSAGYDFGDTVSYGFHDGKDINDNGAGNSDLGKPLYAIADGKIIGVHQHTGANNFGKHFFLQIDGSWGTRYVHYAHCNELFIKLDDVVKEGQRIATVGNTGTVYAHCHFAIKKKPNGMDTIASTKFYLDEYWEDPIKFIEANMKEDIDAIRKERDKNWNLYQEQIKVSDQLRKERDSNWNLYQAEKEKNGKYDKLKQAMQKTLNEN